MTYPAQFIAHDGPFKVDALALGGYTSVVYVDGPTGDGDTYSGTWKHTDQSVTIRWDGRRWVEAPD